MKLRLQVINLIAIFFLPLLLTAQQKIEVFEDKASMSRGNQLGYSIEIPQADHDNIVKEWTKTIRSNTKSKVEEIGHEFNIAGTQISEIHHGPINLYSSILEKDSSIRVIAFFEIDSVFFTFDEENPTIENEKIYHGIKHFMRGFAVEQYKYAVQEELETEEKALKDLNKQYANLKKENEKTLKDIKENEQNIKNSQDAIVTYTADNERKLEEINDKKETVSSLTGDEVLMNQAKDQLKVLEKEKKNIENKLEKENKNIVEYNADIDEANHLIENNNEKIEEIKILIEKQEDVVNAVSLKLRGIK